MNAIEREMYRRKKENELDDITDSFREYRKLYSPIFELYTSDKKRVYGGKANAYGFPAKYDRIEDAIESCATLKNKNRAEIYFKTNNNFEAEYLFIALCQNERWRIDNIKRRWYNNKKWNLVIM